MKKAFSLLEIIFVILLISILALFVISKVEDSLEFGNKAKIKSEIALIRNAIVKKLTSNRLLNINETIKLDNASLEIENSNLFENILDFSLLSTTTQKKDSAKWIKNSSNGYKIYINKEQFLQFSFKNNTFLCESSKELCESFE
ncbi:type II secretion system protein [Halarcobacter anaerophilus]|uniref:Prepilin-type cleavage/methylation domain-containing protein n=1 Tax=Halarcobacter anaerophilus TaxID=877500 RepID=A0A4Q0Y021_9BACT|nr:type II secretion system protein [Halarcobacter anaerophilus]QDF28625.1 hypothetical protein AANAER_1139 [Halarcobacter anaerophilus]RXJ63347.1 hypothetical protein CRV06_06635 [Halarcobacter anaerophilus]